MAQAALWVMESGLSIGNNPLGEGVIISLQTSGGPLALQKITRQKPG
jgi:hypothetical protein